MKKIAAVLLLLLLLLCLPGCAAQQPLEREVFAMDTLMQLKLWGDEADLREVTQQLNRLDAMLSATADESVLAQLNRDASAELPQELIALLTQALSYTQRTGGAFDITVRPLMLAWGFTQDTQRVPEEAEIEALLAYVGAQRVHITQNTVRLHEGTQLDLGGIAKGYAAQCCKALLIERGVSAALLNLGGNVQTLGSKPDGSAWLVGIADPQNPAQSIVSVSFFGTKSLVTSGSYQRYFELDGVRYGHILDPETGLPVHNELASVTVIADDATLADAYSTALFVMGQEEAIAFWRESDAFEAVFVRRDGQILATQGAAPLLSGCEFTEIAR